MDGKPVIEVIYHIVNGVPMLKLGFQFQNQYLYKVIRMFYREDKIKSTWIKFKKICKYVLVHFIRLNEDIGANSFVISFIQSSKVLLTFVP